MSQHVSMCRRGVFFTLFDKSRISIGLLVATWAIGLAGVASVRGATLYSHGFDGSSGDELNGVAPDVRPGSETWVARTNWKADGSIAAGQDSGAWLEFTPAAGNVYTLSMDVNPTNATDIDHWIAIAFAENNAPDIFFADNNTAPWMHLRFSTQNSLHETFLGPATDGVEGYSVTGSSPNPPFTRLAIVLDTTQTQWTAEWFANDESIRQETFGANPTINYVGFGSSTLASGVVDNFQLTAIPEPSALLLAALGIAALCPTCRMKMSRKKQEPI